MTVPIAAAERVLRRFFGHAHFRPGQVDVVRSVLAGRDTLAVLPTGGGKSVCYQVPALTRPGLTIVLSPLISLMKDQVDRLTARGVATACLNSTMTPAEVCRCLESARRGILKLLYVAPERFEAADIQRLARETRIALVAVDEAHCISEWGHEFRPSFRRIGAVLERIGRPQVVALTATATPRVRADIARQLALREPNVIVGGFDRPNLRYAVTSCRGQDEKDRLLVTTLRRETGPIVVYASTRASVQRTVRRLRVSGVRAAGYHAGLDASVRREAQESFMNDRLDAIVATNAFGMGIDKPDVRLVVHRAMPGTLEAYYQEAGRAGRDGNAARCTLLHCASDRETHEWFIAGTFPRSEVVRRVYLALRRLSVRGRCVSPAALVARHCNVTPVEATGAMRLLARSGALLRDSAPTSITLRLLATPTRLSRELASDGKEMTLLRELFPGGSAGVATLDTNQFLDRSGRDALTAMLKSLGDRQMLHTQWPSPSYRLVTRSLDRLVDWNALETRRRAEIAKLDDMERYARTRGCRRRALLSYFGQPGSPDTCSGCDNCLQSHP